MRGIKPFIPPHPLRRGRPISRPTPSCLTNLNSNYNFNGSKVAPPLCEWGTWPWNASYAADWVWEHPPVLSCPSSIMHHLHFSVDTQRVASLAIRKHYGQKNIEQSQHDSSHFNSFSPCVAWTCHQTSYFVAVCGFSRNKYLCLRMSVSPSRLAPSPCSSPLHSAGPLMRCSPLPLALRRHIASTAVTPKRQPSPHALHGCEGWLSCLSCSSQLWLLHVRLLAALLPHLALLFQADGLTFSRVAGEWGGPRIASLGSCVPATRL